MLILLVLNAGFEPLNQPPVCAGLRYDETLQNQVNKIIVMLAFGR